MIKKSSFMMSSSFIPKNKYELTKMTKMHGRSNTGKTESEMLRKHECSSYVWLSNQKAAKDIFQIFSQPIVCKFGT